MTIREGKEILRGNIPILLWRVFQTVGLIIIAVFGNRSVNNTEDIKIKMAQLQEKQIALEQRIARNEFNDASEHNMLRVMNEQQRRDLQDFKEKYMWNFKSQ